MNSSKTLYLPGVKKQEDLNATVETLICLFVYNYCEFQLDVCIVDTEENYPVSIPIKSLQNIPYIFVLHSDVSDLDINCHLPAIHSSKENTFIAGICGVLRWTIKDQIECNPNHYCKELLGFRGGCLVACAESSAWTKFCEVQLPSSVREVSINTDRKGHCLRIPENVLLLEEHLKRPVRTHNILKRKLNIVKKIKKSHANKNTSAVCDPSSNSSEQDINFTLYDDSSVVNEGDLPHKLESMTITEKSDNFSLNHLYLEGIDFTLADMIVFPSVHYILERLHPQAVLHLSHVMNWYERMISKNIVEQAGIKCGLKSIQLKNCVSGDHSISILVPEIDKNSLYKRDPTNTKMKIKHQSPIKLLPLLQEAKISPNYSFNYCSILNWEELPEGLHPLSGDLPEKRISRKCQQIESIVTAVLKVAKPGQTIVEFCAGGGHVGLLLAYFLPSCKVILIENKESSMMRAKSRADDLNFHNVTFYQCNLDYFKGSFHVGVSLHACGVATDLALQQCIKNKASFICCPCCYGGIQNTHLISYPLSEKFQSVGLLSKEYMLLAHCADRNEINTPTAEQGELCMGLIDMDRVYYAEEHKYKTELTKLQPVTCSPKHNLLVGVSPYR